MTSVRREENRKQRRDISIDPVHGRSAILAVLPVLGQAAVHVQAVPTRPGEHTGDAVRTVWDAQLIRDLIPREFSPWGVDPVPPGHLHAAG
jgi:hypothetical protein